MKKTEINMFSDVAQIKEFISQNYDLRYNVLLGQLEISGKPMTDRVCRSIMVAARDKFPDMNGIKSLVDDVLGSDSIPEYNPIMDYLTSLPKWDGVDHVGELLNRIPGMEERQQEWTRTWLRGVLSQWRPGNELYGNQCVLTLIGDQGCRKSTFLQMLMPENLRSYYLDNINLSNQFSRDMALTNNLLVNIDEMDQISERQQAALKFCISRSVVNGRPIYGSTQVRKKRYASFAATTNSPHPLHDVTGSRRFLCVQIPSGDKIDVDTPIDYGQLYAQVVNELDEQHLRSWFTDEEVADIQDFNEQFQTTTDISIMLETCFSKPTGKEPLARKFTLKQIIGAVTRQFPNAAREKALDVRLGIMLTKQGYEKTHTMDGNVYSVLPLVA